MFSFWWILMAFVIGGTGGILLMALVRVAGDEPRQSVRVRALSSTAH